MAANDNLEHCMSQGNEFKLSKKNIFDSQSPAVKEYTDSLSMNKPIENCNNEILHSEVPTEVFKCSSEIPTKIIRRLSLMKLFDPLHSMQQTMRTNGDSHNNTYILRDRMEISSGICDTIFPNEMANKTKLNTYNDDILILLESPRKIPKLIFPKILFSENAKSVKKYSQEEFCQSMKVQELSLRKEFSQTLLEYEKTCAVKNQELNSELSKLASVNRSYRGILSELLATAERMKTSNKKNTAKFDDLLASNEKLKIDIIASKEDSCNMEMAFSNIYKWYEISKSMIKNYTENEKHLTKNIESVQSALVEQERINDLLISRIQDLSDKISKEIDSAKKSADTQIMILETQLKKCEIKISSLDNDLKQARCNSDKLGNIYEDLMKSFRT